MIRPSLLAVSRGDEAPDLILTNARLVNVFTGEIETGSDVAIHADRIAGVGQGYRSPTQTIDMKGSFVAPGFIDAHMHVESTFLPPSEFVKLAVPHGTTGVVLDPHEIANVLGLPGIRYLMENARGLSINAMFALSSCVPATHLETSGARLEADDLANLFDGADSQSIVALAEVMNFIGVVNADPLLLAKINLAHHRFLVDGHAPGLRGLNLQAYAAAGITSDHECTTADEARDKLRAGLRIFIREGSAAKNLEALLPAVTPVTCHRFAFCTDDRHPGDLHNDGHIDHVVRKAIGLGLDPITAIQIATINAAQHYRKRDLGAIAPGFKADIIVFDDLNDLRPRMVFHHGQLVARDGQWNEQPAHHCTSVASLPRTHLRLPNGFCADSFVMRARNGVNSIRVIELKPDQLITETLAMAPNIMHGCYVSDESRDLIKMAVIERHRGTGNIGLGFVRGFGLKAGALASTVGHDSHNLSIVGTNDLDMLVAARTLEQSDGGQCVVCNGRVLACLPLAIAGLMSDQPAHTVIAQQRTLLDAANQLGCTHHDPFMPLSFLSLPVIPHLKLTDLGLVDVDRFEIVPLEY